MLAEERAREERWHGEAAWHDGHNHQTDKLTMRLDSSMGWQGGQEDPTG